MSHEQKQVGQDGEMWMGRLAVLLAQSPPLNPRRPHREPPARRPTVNMLAAGILATPATEHIRQTANLRVNGWRVSFIGDERACTTLSASARVVRANYRSENMFVEGSVLEDRGVIGL